LCGGSLLNLDYIFLSSDNLPVHLCFWYLARLYVLLPVLNPPPFYLLARRDRVLERLLSLLTLAPHSRPPVPIPFCLSLSWSRLMIR
jgi:hypothetical protein